MSKTYKDRVKYFEGKKTKASKKPKQKKKSKQQLINLMLKEGLIGI